MKLSDYVSNFLVDRGCRDIFTISGAGNIRLIDAISQNPKLSYICPHHEQACVMASLTYYRMSGIPGISLVTGGPGATNTITGVASAYLDSIPAIIFAGQEKSEFMAASNRLRGKGVQGLTMVKIVESITKYAVCVVDPNEIRYVLERAFYEAFEGRPGPVWIEIPQDVQSAEIDPDLLKKFIPPPIPLSSSSLLAEPANKILKLLRESKRPLLWVGHGIRLSGSMKSLYRMLDRIQTPALVSWQAADLIPNDHPLYAGRAGTYGQRAANFALQNCDLLIALGTRLAIPQMGYSEQEFASGAKKIVVEIDPAELEKFKIKPHLSVLANVADFLEAMNTVLDQSSSDFDFSNWQNQCKHWQKKYPPSALEHEKAEPGRINSYHFIEVLSQELDNQAVIVTDMGTSLTCTHAAIRLKTGQRLMTSTGLGEMGFGLPGAIGACFGANKRRTIFIGTEGCLMMNLQELQTVAFHKLPLAIFILNNNSYLTIKHTERALFGARLSACSPESGVSFPSMEKIARAFDFDFFTLDQTEGLSRSIRTILGNKGPIFVNVLMPEDQFLGPKSGIKVKSDGSIYSPPLEDLMPYLSRQELEENMLVKAVGHDDAPSKS